MSEELAGDAPELQGEGVSEPNGPSWDAWEKAGINPSEMNPYEVRQYVDWVGELTSADSHEATLEQALRRWGHLNDDESFQDLIALRDQLRSEREDPFAVMNQPPDYDDYGDYANTQESYDEPYGQQPALDPYALREIWKQDMQQELQREREELQQQLQTERLVNDLQGQLENVASSQNLDEAEKEFLWETAMTRLTNQQVDLQDVPSLMESTWNAIDDMYQKRVARAAGRTNSAPSTTGSASATPSDVQQVAGIKSAIARTAERLGIPNE